MAVRRQHGFARWLGLAGNLLRMFKLSQEALADRARLHWTYLSDLERGRQTPTVDVVNRLARALGVTLAEFFAPFDEPFRVRVRKQRSDTA